MNLFDQKNILKICSSNDQEDAHKQQLNRYVQCGPGEVPGRPQQ